MLSGGAVLAVLFSSQRGIPEIRVISWASLHMYRTSHMAHTTHAGWSLLSLVCRLEVDIAMCQASAFSPEVRT